MVAPRRLAVVIAALTAVLLPGASPVAAEADDVLRADRPAARAGSVVRTEPLPEALRFTGGGTETRVWYRSTSWDGGSSVVSGIVLLPQGQAPDAGWPVVSYAHGLTGVADQCAPSVTGGWPNERALVEAFLADGYAVVATDYQGLGTEGPALIANGRTEAYNVIDIVRAARRIAPLSRSWISVGYSMGGHAALFTGALASSYAPALDHRGTIAMAPATQWGLQMTSPAARDPQAPVNFAGLYWATSAGLLYPEEFVLEDVYTPRGLELVRQAENVCVLEMLAEVQSATNGDVYQNPADTDVFVDLMGEDEIPVVRYPRPVRIAQGLDDALAPFSQITADQLAEAGNDVVFLPVAGADHTTLAEAVLPQAREWVRDLFAAR